MFVLESECRITDGIQICNFMFVVVVVENFDSVLLDIRTKYILMILLSKINYIESEPTLDKDSDRYKF